ncbi:MAG: hypothetical protein R2771_06565 [Saprospiraceae bacterium]
MYRYSILFFFILAFYQLKSQYDCEELLRIKIIEKQSLADTIIAKKNAIDTLQSQVSTLKDDINFINKKYNALKNKYHKGDTIYIQSAYKNSSKLKDEITNLKNNWKTLKANLKNLKKKIIAYIFK